MHPFQTQYKLGHVIPFDDQTMYRVADISPGGDRLTLIKGDSAPSATTGRVGSLAYSFVETAFLSSQRIDMAERTREQQHFVLLFFWGTWYEGYRQDLQFVQDLYARNSENAFEVIGIAFDQAESVRSALASQDLRPPTILQDPEESFPIVQFYSIEHYPTAFLIDPSGTIIAETENLRDERFLSTVEHYLGGSH